MTTDQSPIQLCINGLRYAVVTLPRSTGGIGSLLTLLAVFIVPLPVLLGIQLVVIRTVLFNDKTAPVRIHTSVKQVGVFAPVAVITALTYLSLFVGVAVMTTATFGLTVYGSVTLPSQTVAVLFSITSLIGVVVAGWFIPMAWIVYLITQTPTNAVNPIYVFMRIRETPKYTITYGVVLFQTGGLISVIIVLVTVLGFWSVFIVPIIVFYYSVSVSWVYGVIGQRSHLRRLSMSE